MNAYSETSTPHFQKMIHILGEQNVSYNLTNTFDFILASQKGVSPSIINNFRNHFNFSKTDVASMLHVSTSTLYRWIKSGKKLDQHYSMLILELSDVLVYGIEVFGSKEHLLKWLQLPNTALGGLQPRDLLDLPGGISKVKDLIGRIEYGIYS